MRAVMMVALALCASTPALAAPGHWLVGADLERGGSLDLDGASALTGAGVRVGYGLDLGVLELIPEARVMAWGEPELRYGTGELGGRVMFLKILEPGVYARAVLPLGGGGTGPGVAAGGVLDFTAIPALDLGVHAGVMTGLTGVAGVAGAHLTVNF